MVEETQKSPENLSNLDREKLSFFLKQSELSNVFENRELSISWILFLITLQLKESFSFLARQLVLKVATTVEVSELFEEFEKLKDTKDLEIFDVFKPEFIRELKVALQNHAPKDDLVYKSWQLIIRYVDDNPTRLSETNWYKILDRIEQNDNIGGLVNEIVNYLRPRLVIQPNFNSEGQELQPIESLINTDFQNHWYVISDVFIQIWINNANKDTTKKLLYSLTRCIEESLKIASIAGEELKNEDGRIDYQVRSVASHRLNTNRKGFYTIVRVTAEVWKFFVKLDSIQASHFVNRWKKSEFRLLRRLALFASIDKVVSAEVVCSLLTEITDYEFFLSISSVEVYRLIEARWNDLTSLQREQIEERIVNSLDWEFASTRDNEFMISLCFNLLGHMERMNLPLNKISIDLLKEIRNKYPDWELFSREYAGFHYRNYSVNLEPESIDVEDELSVDKFIEESIKQGEIEHEVQKSNWRNICFEFPSKALNALMENTEPNDVPIEFWSIFLLNVSIVQKSADIVQILSFMMDFPDPEFKKLHIAISHWFAASMWEEIETDRNFWNIFDRIAQVDSINYEDDAEKILQIENDSPVNLAEILIRIINRTPLDKTLDPNILKKLKLLLKRTGWVGYLIRMRLSVFLPILFKRFPDLVSKELIPLFDWQRDTTKYKVIVTRFWLTQLGNEGLYTRELFVLLKNDFVKIIDQKYLDPDLLGFFAKQLISIAVSNQSCNLEYQISFPEIRKLLRKSGKSGLPIFASELLNVLNEVEIGDRSLHWKKIVGPIYRGIWPLDENLRTPETSKLLIELICESKAAFVDAFSVVSRFIKKNERYSQYTSSISQLAELGDDCVNSAPKDVLDLLDWVIGKKPKSQYNELNKLLNQIKEGLPSLENSMKFQRIFRLVNRNTY